MHVTRIHKLGLPQNARETFTNLERAGVIISDIATHIRAWVGLRNATVYQHQKTQHAHPLRLPGASARRIQRLCAQGGLVKENLAPFFDPVSTFLVAAAMQHPTS